MKYKLDNEEKTLLESIEKGEWVTAFNSSEELDNYKTIAKKDLKKNKRLNIRISERDLKLLKKQAIREGLPYQSFIASILHKYLNGYL